MRLRISVGSLRRSRPTPCRFYGAFPALYRLSFLNFLLLSLTQYPAAGHTQFPAADKTQPRPLALPLIKISPPPSPPRRIYVPFSHDVTLAVPVAVGTPLQNATLVLDTGSELSWLRCNATDTPATRFDPARSASYAPVPCSSPTCRTQTRDLVVPASCDPRRYCHTSLSYADGSFAEVTISVDAFRIGGSGAAGTVVFGCMELGQSSSPGEEARNSGLLGMNRGALSLVSQMALPSFSYCIPGSDAAGVLLLGDAPSQLNYTPLVAGPSRSPNYDRLAYTVRLEGIKVAGEALPIPRSALEPDRTGAGQTMVDSGTQFTFLMGPVYGALRSAFLNRTGGVLRALDEPGFVFQGAMDLCYRVPRDGRALPPLPEVAMVFGEGAEMAVKGGERLLYATGEVREGEAVHCFTFGNSDLLGVAASLIGHHQQQDTWVEFDVRRSRLGLAPSSCKWAAQKLGIAGPY